MSYKKQTNGEPRVYQFKNSFHFGFTNSEEPHGLRQSKKCEAMLSNSVNNNPQIVRLSLSKSRSIIDNSRQMIQKIGLTIDDEGNVILAEWMNGKIQGDYFLYKPNTFEYSEYKGHHPGVCQYGSMSNGMLEGDNYLYDISGQMAKSIFMRDKIMEKSHIFSLVKLIDNSIKSLECQVINFPVNNRVKQQTNMSGRNPVVPPLKKISEKQKKRVSLDTETIVKDSIKSPTLFFEKFVKKYREYCENKDDKIVLRYIDLNEQKSFIGFIKNVEGLQYESMKELSQSSRLSKINGWGIMLKNEWPERYGVFENGKLSGFGRRYVSELVVHDGLFEGDQLIDGFIFDYINGKTYLGVEDRESGGFKVVQEVDEISEERMMQYKKRWHLKAIGYTNNYFNLPSLVYRSPWPLLVSEKMTKNNLMFRVLKEFRPQYDLSEIQRKNITTENRVEREIIREMGEQQIFPDREREKMKTFTIKNLLGMYLTQRHEGEIQNVVDQYEFQNNIDQYIKILQQQNTSKNKGMSTIDSQRQNREKQKKRNNVSVYFNEIKQCEGKEQNSRQQKTEKKRQVRDLHELINEYKECETERGSLVSPKVILSGSTLKKKEILSKRSMIKYDNELLNLKKTKGMCKCYCYCHCHSKKKQPALDLRKMYKQYMHIQKDHF